MQRKFQLASVIDEATTDTIRYDSLEVAQGQPWGEDVVYRILVEEDVPDNPLMEPLVINLWYQTDKDDPWIFVSPK